jgi:hypothetical protein
MNGLQATIDNPFGMNGLQTIEKQGGGGYPLKSPG